MCFAAHGRCQGVVDITENNILFKGHDNRIILGKTEEVRHYLLSSLDAFVHREGDEWIVRPFQNRRGINLQVTDTEGNLMCEYNYRAATLPNPTVFWGISPDGNAISRDETRLFCRYQPFLMIDDQEIKIEEFMVSVIGKTFKGSGHVIPAELTRQLKELPSGTFIQLTIKTTNKNGQRYEYDAFFTLE